MLLILIRCRSDALSAGFARPANFRAFLSSSLQDLTSVVYRGDASEVPVVNLVGERLFDNWDGIFDGNGAQFRPWITPILSFNGSDVLTSDVW